MQSDKKIFFNLEGMPDLLEIQTLVFENLHIENFRCLKLPKKLPNLKHLQILDCPLKSLEGLPSELPNLKSISIGNIPNLQNLQGFPNLIPEFVHFTINTLSSLCSLEGLPSELPNLNHIIFYNLPKLHSFKGLPFLPRLSDLEIYDVDFYSFKHLPKNLPSQFSIKIWNYNQKDHTLFDMICSTPFRGLDIQDFIIKDFSFLNNFTVDDLKRAEFIFTRCIIQSFEGFPSIPENTNLKEIFDLHIQDFDVIEPSITFSTDTKIRSFSGLSLPFLKYILPHYILSNLFDFAPQGKKFLNECIDREYLESTNYENIDSSLKDEKILQLYEYFKIPVIELALQYISDPTSLPLDQIDRLIRESDHDIRKILENSLPPNNPVILQISQRISFKTQNGYKILK